MIDLNQAAPDDNGLYTVNPRNQGDVVLIHGSCRMIPYVNYINESTNKYKIIFLRAFGNDLERAESNANLHHILKSVKIFIFEHSQNIGVLNTDASQEKNIYQIGLNPDLSIQIPSFNNIFILFNDYFDQSAVSFTTSLIGSHDPDNLSDSQILSIYKDGEQQIQRFVRNCLNTSIPEFADHFLQNYLSTRLFCSFNHTHRNYTHKVWELINDRFLHLYSPTNLAFMSFYENSQTELHPYDNIHRTFSWLPEPQN